MWSVVPVTLGRVGPEGLLKSCSQVTRPEVDRSGETGSGNRGWNEDENTEGSGERYCLRKG